MHRGPASLSVEEELSLMAWAEEQGTRQLDEDASHEIWYDEYLENQAQVQFDDADFEFDDDLSMLEEEMNKYDYWWDD